MRALITSILLTGLVVLGGTANATHLIGGNLGYAYIGETAPGSQIYRYQVYVEFYMNCGDDSNWQFLYDILNTNGGVMPVGVYPQDPAAPNANKPLLTVANLALVDSAYIVPDLPGGCSVGAGLCTERGYLTGTVDLPLNFGGYHLYFQMNARNLSITNLFNPNNTGIGYYAFIPPPLLQNSSPIWLGVPTPLLCINDTSTFVNSATDPDGDQLIFSFEVPYNSVDNGGGIIPPPNQLPNAIPLVNYVGGYSVNQPFGAGGYSFINGATGLTQYMPTVQGNYVVAVEVKEYRNGVLIGRTRRDLQLQAVVCPPNDAPESVGTQGTSFTVQAGDVLCFDIGFEDPNADSLLLTASGTIFDGNLFNPPATIMAPISGSTTVGSTFCWDTDCSQAQDQPYLFSVSVTDNGCPPRTLDVVYQVTVQGFAGPTSITGAAQVCTGANGSAYSTVSISGADYLWSVSGGVISNGQGTSAITVDWGTAGPGSVQVFATNAQGCSSSPVSLPVNIAALPVANAGSDIAICPGQSTPIGGAPTGPAGSGYTWSPAIGLSSASAANPTATPSATTAYIVQVSNAGCVSRDTIIVTVNQPTVSASDDAALCLGGSVQLNATGVGTFQWSPAAGLDASDIADPVATPGTTTTYVVELSDGIGCTAIDSVTIVVNALPVVDAGIDATPCPGTAYALGGNPTGPAGGTFAWTPSIGLSNASSPNPTLTVSTDQVYIVSVTDVNQCTSSDTVEVTVLPLPDVDAGPDLEVCFGGSIQLQGSGNGNLLWTPNFGLSDPTIPDPICTPEQTTVYTLTVTDANTCTNSDQALVTVNVLPSADAGPDRVICLGDSVTIGMPSPGSFTWSPANGLSDPNTSTPLASPAVSTMYHVTVSDSNACALTDSVFVSVTAPISAGGDGSVTICSNMGAWLFDYLTGPYDPSGGWQDPAFNDDDANFELAFGDDPGNWYYIVQVVNSACPPDTAVVQVSVNPLPEAGFDQNVTVCSSDAPFPLPLSLGIDDTTGTWYDPNLVATANMYTPGTSPAGTYLYVLMGAAPCPNDTAFVTVSESAAVDPGENGSVLLCGSGTAFTMTDSLGGTPNLGGAWFTPTNAPHLAQFDPGIDPEGTWFYVTAAGTACQDTALLTIALIVPTPTFNGDDVLCAGDTSQITVSGGVSYLWSPTIGISDPAISDPLVFPDQSTTYTVTITDENGCLGSGPLTITVHALPAVDAGTDAAICAGGSADIGGSPTSPTATSFTWTPATGLSNVSDPNPTATPSVTTTYSVSVMDANQCANADEVTITVNPLPSIDAGPDLQVCSGSNVTIDATGSGNFAWSPETDLNDPTAEDPIATPATTQTYTVTLTDANGCIATDEVVVTVNAPPTADAGTDSWLCQGFAADLSGSTSGGTAAWSPSASIADAGALITTASPTATTTFTLTITDANNCVASDVVTITVGNDPPIDAGPDATTCGGIPVQLGGSPTSVAGSSFSWSPAIGLDDPSSPNPLATIGVTTTYTLTVSNDTCTSSQPVTISIGGNGQADFSARFEAGCDALRGFFIDESTDAITWHWDFGNGANSQSRNPQAFLPYGTNSLVTLIITDASGCADTTSQLFTMDTYANLVSIDVPNVFTPNGDGQNDVFTLDTQAFLGPCADMHVYNRWGEAVFVSQGGNITWDGRNFSGEPCVAGTYFYAIEVNGLEFKGSLTLLR
ncbi:MAG: gliding motility-associated C-terminal domain-containing protein [Flavobacteriales bacterium]|nr:gliding motility-associated C-terminal domain-containing protein [Flavobacteriales bacterium]